MPTASTQARCLRAGLLIVSLALVTACGGGSKKSDNTTPSSTGTSSASASTTDAPTGPDQTSSSAAGASCNPSAAVLATAKTFAEIKNVSLIGGCGQLSAETTLAPGALGSPSVTRALTICTALSKVAYVGSVYGVSVEGKDGHELAASTKGQQCI